MADKRKRTWQAPSRLKIINLLVLAFAFKTNYTTGTIGYDKSHFTVDMGST